MLSAKIRTEKTRYEAHNSNNTTPKIRYLGTAISGPRDQDEGQSPSSVGPDLTTRNRGQETGEQSALH